MFHSYFLYFFIIFFVLFNIIYDVIGEKNDNDMNLNIVVDLPEGFQVPQYDQKGLEDAIKKKESVFVKFYSPQCGHCKKMSPVWEKLGAMFRNNEKTHIASVDCLLHRELCASMHVKAYPTMRLFKNNVEEVMEFSGTRDLASFAAFLSRYADIPIAFEDSDINLPEYSVVKSPLFIFFFAFIPGLIAGCFLLCFGPDKKMNPPKVYATIVQESTEPGHGNIYRSIVSESFPKPAASNLYDNFQLGVKKFPERNCIGYRRISTDGEAKAFEWMTYAEVNKRLQNLGAGMMHLGMVPSFNNMRMIAIYMKNCPEWVIAEQAMFSCGGATVPLYDTLGGDSTEYILNQTGIGTVVCGKEQLAKLMRIKSKIRNLATVILVGERDNNLETEAKNMGFVVRSMTEIEDIGENNPRNPTPQNENDIATFMYTSGTTGNPKGVMLSHKAMLVNAEAITMHSIHGGINPFTEETIHFSYLPLAHAFERTAQICVFSYGGSVGFYQGNPLKLVDDLKELRPTIFCSVPRLLNKIHDKIISGAQSGSFIKSFLFRAALVTKKAYLRQGYVGHWFWDKLIFNKIRMKLGLDRCCLIVTGSAPISPDVLDFLRIAFLCPVVEGYGQTEGSCATNITHFGDCSSGTVGGPLCSVEIKLVSVPDMGYEVTDTTHGENNLPCCGRGEICFRGPSIFSGYYQLPDETKVAIDKDGWLHSGDIGLWTVDKRLKIVDRKKNIFKLSQGEYVAPEKIENILIGSQYVAQCFVYGDSFHSHLVAVVVPDENALVDLGKNLGVEPDMEPLCKEEEIHDIIQKDIEAVSKNAKLAGFEIVRQFYLTSDPFSVENGILTPTFKLKRNEAKRIFEDEINAMYEKSGDMIAGKNIVQN